MIAKKLPLGDHVTEFSPWVVKSITLPTGVGVLYPSNEYTCIGVAPHNTINLLSGDHSNVWIEPPGPERVHTRFNVLTPSNLYISRALPDIRAINLPSGDHFTELGLLPVVMLLTRFGLLAPLNENSCKMFGLETTAINLSSLDHESELGVVPEDTLPIKVTGSGLFIGNTCKVFDFCAVTAIFSLSGDIDKEDGFLSVDVLLNNPLDTTSAFNEYVANELLGEE